MMAASSINIPKKPSYPMIIRRNTHLFDVIESIKSEKPLVIPSAVRIQPRPPAITIMKATIAVTN